VNVTSKQKFLSQICLKQLGILIALFSVSYLSAQDDLNLEHAIVGIYAVNTENGKVLIDQNSDLSLVPASCMKIVTTATALHLLGSDYRFETSLEYDGEINEETLHGNLYIRGGGDPCLGSDRISGSLSWETQIEAWVSAVQKLGIKKIEGKVIADATKWEKALAAPSWAWEDLGNYYGAGACALSFHENSYSLFFRPGIHEGENTSILRTEPPLTSFFIRNEVKTGPQGSGDRACIYGSEYSFMQFVRGTVPAGVNEFAIKGAIPNPAEYCAELFAAELMQKGITIDLQEIQSSTGRTAIHKTLSPPVGEIVHWTNQKSINLYAEHLLKKMGELMYKEGSTQAGIKAVAQFWRSKNVDLGGFNMVDGSGLSRKNLITTKQLVSLLLQMKKSDHFSLFLGSLPEQEGSIKAKSGSMSSIKGYVGYSGDVAFAILVNNCIDYAAMNKKIKLFLSHLCREELKNSEYANNTNYQK
jgi:D-alanyl-D-alanine carboxypeptidase/D-alanyl-D-alanine-endopeptidase (penicillin-binding protein 4)